MRNSTTPPTIPREAAVRNKSRRWCGPQSSQPWSPWRSGLRSSREVMHRRSIFAPEPFPSAGIALPMIHKLKEHSMIKRFAVIAVAVAGMGIAMPAGAEEVGVGVGPVGVTVGNGHGDLDRDRVRAVIREQDHRDRDNAVVIKNGHDHDRDMDRDHKTVIIDHQ